MVYEIVGWLLVSILVFNVVYGIFGLILNRYIENYIFGKGELVEEKPNKDLKWVYRVVYTLIILTLTYYAFIN